MNTETQEETVDFDKDQSAILNILIASVTILFAIQKNYFIYYKPKATIFVISIIAVYGYIIIDSKLAFITAIFLFVSLLEIIDNFLWKYPPFCWMFTVRNFSGTYKGKQVSSRVARISKIPDSNNMICKVLEKSLGINIIIYQTGSKIHMHSFYYDSRGRKSSKSESKNVMITKSVDGQHFTLTYNYGDIGVLKKGGHHGTTILKLIKKEDETFIEGGYYTNRNPQTRGEFVSLKRVSRETNHPF